MRQTITLEQLGPALESYLGRIIPAVYTSLRYEIVTEFLFKVQALSPVASGRYRGSHVVAAGVLRTVALATLPAYPILGEPEVAAILAAAPASVPIYIANAARDPKYADRPGSGSYARLLEDGRREYTRLRTGTTMWVGSTQAPHGIYGPAREALLGERVTIVSNAIARVREAL